MFKNNAEILQEMFPNGEIQTELMNTSHGEAFVDSYVSGTVEIDISGINDEYPMQTFVIKKFVPMKNKEKEINEIVKKYIELSNKYEHHCLLDFYDLTNYQYNMKVCYYLAKHLSHKPIQQRLIGDGKEFIQRKIKELKKYK